MYTTNFQIPFFPHELRAHSLRKFFKTNMVAAGVPESHADYMMGHVSDTYNQVQSLGVDKLRSIYANAGLRIRARTKANTLDLVKRFITSHGLNPDQILTREALLEGATSLGPGELEDHQLAVLRKTFSDLVSQDVQSAVQKNP